MHVAVKRKPSIIFRRGAWRVRRSPVTSMGGYEACEVFVRRLNMRRLDEVVYKHFDTCSHPREWVASGFCYQCGNLLGTPWPRGHIEPKHEHPWRAPR